MAERTSEAKIEAHIRRELSRWMASTSDIPSSAIPLLANEAGQVAYEAAVAAGMVVRPDQGPDAGTLPAASGG